MYSNFLYGEKAYGSTEDKYNDYSDKAPYLMPYLPYYYQESTITKEIQNAIEKELGFYLYNIEDLEKQIFISTATWGLNIYEKMLNINPLSSQTVEDRRQAIIAKLRGRGTTTKKMIIDTAESFSGGDVDVIEHFDKYVFTVKFIGHKGIPRNLDIFKKQIESIKPAHLAMDFDFVLITYDMLNRVLKVTYKEPKTNNITYRQMKEYRVDEIEGEVV